MSNIDLTKSYTVNVVRMSEDTLGFRVIQGETEEFFLDTLDGFLDDSGESLDCDDDSFDSDLVDMLTDAGNKFIVWEVKQEFCLATDDNFYTIEHKA